MDSGSEQIRNGNNENNSDKVKNAVSKIFKQMNKSNKTKVDIAKLSNEYGTIEMAAAIQQAWGDKLNYINKKSKKFAQLIRGRYSDSSLPFHIILEKARLFKSKYGLSEDEFSQFQRIYEQELIGLKSSEVITPATNMMKILGSVSLDIKPFNNSLNDHDAKILQDIVKLHASSKALHAQVILQSVQYEDCAYEAVTGGFKRELGHRPSESIHAVVAALFIPKFDVIESHFLHSNITSIVRSRFNSEPLTTKSDYELFYALTNDPNDIICNNDSSIHDLYNRALIQNQLWNAVLNLRNGQYYGSQFSNFVSSIDMCKLNKYDTPDLVYGRYDGTVLKRLISAFSFRPTIVSTMPLFSPLIVNVNPYQQNIRPVVTNVSMINLKLPPVLNNSTPVDLKDSLESSQLFLENGVITSRNTSIIYSKGVLIFYIDRRTNIVRPQDMQPFNINRLPLTISGFERLNDREVNFDTQITISKDIYQLRSVVVAELNTGSFVDKNIVIGSSTLLMKHSDNNTSFRDEYLIYDPINVYDTIPGIMGAPTIRPPIRQLHRDNVQDSLSFTTMANKRGIIFIYALVSDNSGGEIHM